VKARAFLLAYTAASLLPALAFADTSLETDSPPILQAGPRIIHIPEPPKSAPKRHVDRPQKQPEAAKPISPEAAKPAPPQEAAKPAQPQELLAPPEAAMPARPKKPDAERSQKPLVERPQPLVAAPPPTEGVKPAPAPAAPSVRTPAQTKANRKIWI